MAERVNPYILAAAAELLTTCGATKRGITTIDAAIQAKLTTDGEWCTVLDNHRTARLALTAPPLHRVRLEDVRERERQRARERRAARKAAEL
jgi:hypothetical protein